uniref:Metalloendopeptidase n=1 Tax=Oreochromis niloticus TaxID=8128 RepID=A0A669BGU5_ORENI
SYKLMSLLSVLCNVAVAEYRKGDASVFLTAPDIDEPTLIGGDIAIKSEADRNADPCTSRSCMWGKWSDGKVYVPYYIGGGQTVSLSRQGCLYHSTVQHELLHALGFNHEQTRSDRDNYIRVYWENILDDMEYNFYKIDTLNQGTPYDYNSLMQYERYAFSKNNQPTMVPIPNSNVMLGGATQMSKNDIDRLNRLYQFSCKNFLNCRSAGLS